MTVAGLVLAAGAGRRFGQPKALVEMSGERLVDRAAQLAVLGGCDPVVVVSGAAPLEVAGATVVDNAEWASGMGSSLRIGLGAMPAEVTATVVLLVDTPWLDPESVKRVSAVGDDESILAVATYGGERGHPVLLGREHWSGVAEQARGDVGARGYLVGRADVIEVDCTGLGDPTDVDVPLAGSSPK